LGEKLAVFVKFKYEILRTSSSGWQRKVEW